MIKQLLLGNKQFPVNLIQGPLAGISCAPFRYLTWKYSKPAFSCTEMISCKTLLHQKSHQRFTAKNPEEGPVCFQLSGNDPSELAEATKIVTDCGADLIDLNCGCPVNKIRNKGAGSKLLTDAAKLYQLIYAMKNSTHLPISIKIRVQSNSGEKFNSEVAKVVSDAGADFLVVHGRHWTEQYETLCHYNEIQFFVEELKIPVIGNGDISCQVSLKKMFDTGCAGVMISRAGVGQPWLIAKLIAEMQGEVFISPSNKEVGLMFIEHITQLAQILRSEKFSIVQARKFSKYYARGIEKRSEFCAAMNVCERLDDLKDICLQYFT